MSRSTQIPRYPALFDYITTGFHEVNSFPIHWHSYYEFEFVMSDENSQIINGTPCTYNKGDVFLLGPTDFHERTVDGSAKIRIIKIPLGKMPSVFYRNGLQKALPVRLRVENTAYNELSTLLSMLENSVNSKNDQLTESILTTILLFVFSQETIPLQNTPNNRIGQIYNFLQNHFTEQISIADIAKAFSFNDKYLCTYFKRHTGKTITDSIREMRLVHASHLVLSSEKSLQEIFPQCGYNSQSFFLRDFKKRFGITPTQMRKLQKS